MPHAPTKDNLHAGDMSSTQPRGSETKHIFNYVFDSPELCTGGYLHSLCHHMSSTQLYSELYDDKHL